jgi:hypothetical protein
MKFVCLGYLDENQSVDEAMNAQIAARRKSFQRG